MKKIFYSIFFLIFIFSTASFVYGYKPWSENVFRHIKDTYGDQAEKRFHFLHKLILENQNSSIEKKLILVNKTLNDLPWIADKRHWKSSDYWATPLETIATFGGDCEDIAVAKWIMLRHLGIPKKSLALAYVKIKKTFESHMVLLYFHNAGTDEKTTTPFVLDNYVNAVRKGSDRTDLWAIYSTDADGTITLYTDNGKQRGVKGVYKKRKIRKLDELKKRIAADMIMFKKINGGIHPLL